MRGFLILLLAVLVSIGVGIGVVAGAGVGQSPTSRASKVTSIETALASLGASPDLQLTTSFSRSQLGPSGNTIQGLSILLEASTNNHTTDLSDAALARSGLEIALRRNGNDLIDIRLIDGTEVYLKTDLSAIADIPGVSTAAKAAIANVAPLLDGRWFELPKAILDPLIQRIQAEAKSQAAADKRSSPIANKSALRRLRAKLLQDFKISTALNDSGQETTISASFRSIEATLLPIIEKAARRQLGTADRLPVSSLSSVSGELSVHLFSDSPGAPLNKIVGELHSKGESLEVLTYVGHQNIAIGVPGGARMLPVGLIERLFATGAPALG